MLQSAKNLLLSGIVKMRIFFLLSCLIFCSACGIAQKKVVSVPSMEKSQIPISKDTVITKHYYYFGALYDREYELTIKGTGEVIFGGKTSLKDDKGVYEQWSISQDDLARLVEAFHKANFFLLNNKYGKITGTHGASITMKIIIDGKEKTVEHLLNDEKEYTPEERTLRDLELLINKTVEAESRIRRALDFRPEYVPFEHVP